MKYFLIFLTISFIGGAQVSESFERGNQFYNTGSYEKAISEYKSILSANLHSASLYYNLANCYYKLNEVALSVYYYEKALLLDPASKDIKINLSFAQKMTIDSIERITQSGFSMWFSKTLNSLSVDGWATRCVGLTFLFVFLFLCYLLSYSESKKRVFFISCSLVLALLVGSILLLFNKDRLNRSVSSAIIFVKEIDAKLEPSQEAETVFALHEGTKVLVIERYGAEWSKVKLQNGETGWILNSKLKEL